MPTKTGLRRSIFSDRPGARMDRPSSGWATRVARRQSLLGPGGRSLRLRPVAPQRRGAGQPAAGLRGGAADPRRCWRATSASAGGAWRGAAGVGRDASCYWYMVAAAHHVPRRLGLRRRARRLAVGSRPRTGAAPAGFLLLGLVLGVAMCVRWQNGVLLILPGLELRDRLWRARALAALGRAQRRLLAAGRADRAPSRRWPPGSRSTTCGCSPTRPTARTSFASTIPSCWRRCSPRATACCPGRRSSGLATSASCPLLRRRPAWRCPLLVPLLAVMTYVNMCSGDWWAGGVFLQPALRQPAADPGRAASRLLDRRFLRRWPAPALGRAGRRPVLRGLEHDARRAAARGRSVPRVDTVRLPDARGAVGADPWPDAVGSPPTWPASWLFAWRQGRSPGQYDRLVGRYLFYRQNNLRGHVELGAAGRGLMLGEGWGPVGEPAASG